MQQLAKWHNVLLTDSGFYYNNDLINLDAKLEYESGMANYIMLDIDSYSEKCGDKAIRKNLTIPAWLNTIAEKHNINFSRVLQNALQSELKEYLPFDI